MAAVPLCLVAGAPGRTLVRARPAAFSTVWRRSPAGLGLPARIRLPPVSGGGFGEPAASAGGRRGGSIPGAGGTSFAEAATLRARTALIGSLAGAAALIGSVALAEAAALIGSALSARTAAPIGSALPARLIGRTVPTGHALPAGYALPTGRAVPTGRCAVVSRSAAGTSGFALFEPLGPAAGSLTGCAVPGAAAPGGAAGRRTGFAGAGPGPRATATGRVEAAGRPATATGDPPGTGRSAATGRAGVLAAGGIRRGSAPSSTRLAGARLAASGVVPGAAAGIAGRTTAAAAGRPAGPAC